MVDRRRIADYGFLSDCATAALVDRGGSVDWWCAPRFDSPSSDEPVQIVSGVGGQRDLTERTLDHLDGFGGSRPVRVGNDAYRQVQLDVLGEVLDAAFLLRDSPEVFTPAVRDLLVALADRAADTWADPDAGMWEARDATRHYTSSKVMCWVALDRAVTLAPQRGDAGRTPGAFGSDELDASVLVLPLVRFLPMTDPTRTAGRRWATCRRPSPTSA